MKGLVIGGLVGFAAIALLAPATGDAVGRLAIARAERDGLATAPVDAARPIGADAWRASDRQVAIARVADALRGRAARGGVLIEDLTPLPDRGGLARLHLRASGGEAAVIAFADGTERARPIARFAAWRVERAGGSVRLTGELVAPWQ